MTTIRFIGDVHGKYGTYRKLLKDSPHQTIQVGDMGVGFRRWPHGEWEQNPPYDLMVSGGHRFIRGNHDNPSACSRHTQYIADGHIEGPMMFIGGALSIDRAYRYEDYSWWPDEELAPESLELLITKMIEAKPKIMITHECPESVAAMIVGTIPDLRSGGFMKMDPRFASRTREAFDRMFGVHQPKLWLFGHWHVPFDYMYRGTRFVCLPELETLDVDIDQ
jgi:hypothetical protein